MVMLAIPYASSTLALPVGLESTTWKRLGNGFKDPVFGVSVTSRNAFLCPGSKVNKPSDLAKSCPATAGDTNVRPIGSGFCSSLKQTKRG